MNTTSQGNHSDNNHCGICFDGMANYGPHQVVCLKCGHLFCLRCIDTALTYRKVCPVCNMEAKKSDIRRLFFTKVDIRDELSFHEMESNYMKEKSARERLENDLLLKEQELDRLKRELYERDKQLSDLQQPAMKRQELSVDPDDIDVSSIIADPTFISISNSVSSPTLQREELPNLENIAILNENTNENTNQTFKFSNNYRFIVPIDNPRHLCFSECDYNGNALSNLSSVFFTSSSCVYQSDLSVSGVASCLCRLPKDPSSLASFPNMPSPLLLISYANQAILWDVRERCFSSSILTNTDITTCCTSQRNFQFFVCDNDGIGEYDMRLPIQPLNYIQSPATSMIHALSSVSFLRVNSNSISQYAFNGTNWMLLSRFQQQVQSNQITYHIQDDQLSVVLESPTQIELCSGTLNLMNYQLSSLFIQNNMLPAENYNSCYQPCIFDFFGDTFVSKCFDGKIHYYSCSEPFSKVGICELPSDVNVCEELSLYHIPASLLVTNKGIAVNNFSELSIVFSNKHFIHIVLPLLIQIKWSNL